MTAEGSRFHIDRAASRGPEIFACVKQFTLVAADRREARDA